MTILYTILIGLAALIVLILALALVLKKSYQITCETTINAPLPDVFNYVKQLKKQDYFNKWVMADPNMQRNFKGTDGTVGFIYAWNGNNQAGEGELEITQLIDNKSVHTEIRFVRPFKSVGYNQMHTEAINPTTTKVIWSNQGEIKYPLNILLPMVTKMLGKDMQTSLGNLNAILTH
jgi:hypothetical protein